MELPQKTKQGYFEFFLNAFSPKARPAYIAEMKAKLGDEEWQGSLLLIKRGGCLPFKYSNFQQIYKKNSANFIKKLRSDKVGSNPTLPKGQKPK